MPALVRPETWQDVGLLTIGPKSYGFRCYPGNPAAGCTRVVRLFTDGGFSGDSYDVTFHAHHAPLCTCADFTYRKAGTADTCKHVKAVVALELDRPAEAAPVTPDQLNEAPF